VAKLWQKVIIMSIFV